MATTLTDMPADPGYRQSLTYFERLRIRILLHDTELSCAEIAKRMNVAKSVIVRINRQFRVRDYAGNRCRWKDTISDELHDTSIVERRTKQ